MNHNIPSTSALPKDFKPNIALRDAIHWYTQDLENKNREQEFYRCLCKGSLLVGTLVDASLGADRCTQTAYDINLFTVENDQGDHCIIGFTDMDAFKQVVDPSCGISAMTCKQAMELAWAYGHSNFYVSIGSQTVAVSKDKLEILLST